MDLIDALVLKELKGVGDDTISSLLDFTAKNALKSLEEIAEFGPRQLPFKRVPSSLIEFLSSGDFNSSREIISGKYATWKKQGIEVLFKGGADYPVQLLEVSKPPPFLFCKGRVNLLKDTKAIAVVGTRKNTRIGEKITEKTVEEFAGRGFTVVSGLALGIDAIAHKAALKFQAPTIAVLVDLVTVSPAGNRGLADDILDNQGLLVSENPPGTNAIPAFFAKRDRIQAGLSVAVFAIETAIDGGTMHAVNASHLMGRPVFVPDASVAGYSDLSIQAIAGTQELVKNRRAIPYTRDSYTHINSELERISDRISASLLDSKLL